MEHQGRLVAEDSLLARPEPDDDQVFVVARGKVDQTKEATTDALQPPVVDVVLHELRGVARLASLRLGHVPGLGRRALVEPVPGGGPRNGATRHAR